MPAAVPLVMAGVSAYSAYQAHKDATKASTPSPAETAALTAQTGATNALSKQSSQLSAFGMPKLQQAGGYFSTLASGNRGAMTQALSPEISSINDVYGGTARTMSRFLRGPEKDVQLAEAERGRAGQIGSLFTGARGSANSALAGMGANATGAAAGGFGSAGSLFGSAAGMGMENRFAGAALQRQSGQDIGGLMFNLLKMYSQKGGTSSGFYPTGAGAGQPSDTAGWG